MRPAAPVFLAAEERTAQPLSVDIEVAKPDIPARRAGHGTELQHPVPTSAVSPSVSDGDSGVVPSDMADGESASCADGQHDWLSLSVPHYSKPKQKQHTGATSKVFNIAYR